MGRERVEGPMDWRDGERRGASKLERHKKWLSGSRGVRFRYSAGVGVL